ncbi:hypothetical protein [Nocardia seriolae]|uniref:HEAT repeat domain-containing protein n=1 Tax=Nocardia seriolae TaxID=37332 RepID=A0A0B8NDP2_9NOCA|nr:hypothetical protein [Nocardia seriolae]APA98767.1 hypothetical protein NS506_04721 [Nocardia seriolae]MTJ63840.1 hypothetical protein [Nocardia seriolae]MTJ71439.1 hypothetical protein [Nocardia seriolae]MTJ88399.1 hypothetical protein [Nocardia seriolae]MTK32384.1 hypothetical protein [Nocardia seriolae]
MSDLVTRAQITLLSRTLHVPEERLAHLEKLGAANLHELQERLAKVMFAEHNAIFSRLSLLVPIIPLSISLPLVQKMVPPVMAGRAAGAIGVDHPKKAAEAVGMLEPGYAAAAAPYMDPHSVGQLADIAPPKPVMKIINELLRRGDYITAGPFLAYATPELVRAVEEDVHDDEGLIRSASYSYSGENISIIIRHLLAGTGRRIPRLVRTIVDGSKELRLAALSVFARCDADVIVAIGDILFDTGSPDEIADLVGAFIADDAVPETLRFVGQLSPSALDLLAANPITAEATTVEAITNAVDGSADAAQWRGLLELAERTEAGVARRIGGAISHFDTVTLTQLLGLASTAHLWPPLLKVLATAEPDAQSRIGESWSALPVLERGEIEQHIGDLGLNEALTALTATLQLTQ